LSKLGLQQWTDEIVNKIQDKFKETTSVRFHHIFL
jgi:hypothetical protein